MSYIKLQDAKNAIMTCITEQTVSKYATSAECRSARHGADIALFALDDLPTADVVEVVRCKDCFYSEKTLSDECPKECSWCRKLCFITHENHYCSYGERKEK